MTHTLSPDTLSPEQCEQFQRDGYLMMPQMFSPEEMDLMKQVAKADRSIEQDALTRADGEGGITKLRLWNQAGDDLYGTVARSERIVNRMEQLLDDEVYYYHSKMNFKEPLTGGAWAWHQDYGYWYNNGCLFPDMASCMIAIDPCTKENGCLQVLRGSHLMGRINHGTVGEQAGADPERVEQAVKRFELIYCLMQPGDALLFHSNLLHRSDQNTSPDPRWSYICCYNAKHNDPYKEGEHPGYSPLKKLRDDAILEWGSTHWKTQSAQTSSDA